MIINLLCPPKFGCISSASPPIRTQTPHRRTQTIPATSEPRAIRTQRGRNKAGPGLSCMVRVGAPHLLHRHPARWKTSYTPSSCETCRTSARPCLSKSLPRSGSHGRPSPTMHQGRGALSPRRHGGRGPESWTTCDSPSFVAETGVVLFVISRPVGRNPLAGRCPSAVSKPALSLPHRNLGSLSPQPNVR